MLNLRNTKNHFSTFACFAVCLAGQLLFSAGGFAKEVTPVEFTGRMQTPGIGFQTFYQFAEDDSNTTDHYPNTGSAYIRYYWEILEPTEGQYNFAMIDEHLAKARANNQTLEFRIMLMDDVSNRVPQWLLDKGVPNVAGTNFLDTENLVTRTAHDNLVRAMGQRYDDHPDLGSIDIGSVGFWGEWHTYTAPAAMPSVTEQKRVVDLYHEVFPKTPLVGLIGAGNINDGDSTVLQYIAGKGRTGWRGDSWGDAEGPSWNHHDNSYTPGVAMIPNAWQNGPVAMEPGVPNGTMPFDSSITRAVDDAISWHASLIHNKSAVIPTDYLPELDRLVDKLGFRLVLRKATFDNIISLDEPNTIALEWENLGIAPPYRDHRIALRLVNEAGEQQAVVTTEQSIRGWLPGDKQVSVDYRIPAGTDLDRGKTYHLEMGLVFHSAIDRLVPIAIEGKTADGWYRLATTATAMRGDFNEDGQIDGSDYLLWQINSGTSSGAKHTDGDANADGSVDQHDLQIWQNEFGTTIGATSQSTTIPEPSTILLATGALLMVGQQSRSRELQRHFS